jgi:hypothetical protein
MRLKLNCEHFKIEKDNAKDRISDKLNVSGLLPD